MCRIAILLLCLCAAGCEEAYDVVSDLIDAQIDKAAEKEKEEEEEEVLPPALYDFRIEDRTEEFVPDLARVLGWLFVIDGQHVLPEAMGLGVSRHDDFVEFEVSREFLLRGTLATDTAELVLERDGDTHLDGVFLIRRESDRHWEITGKIRVTPGTCDLTFVFDGPFTVLFPEPTGLIVGTIAGMSWSGAIEVEGRLGSDDTSFRLEFDGTGTMRGADLRVSGEPQEAFELDVPVSSELVSNLRPCLESYDECHAEIETLDGLMQVTVQRGLDRVAMTVATLGVGLLATDWVLIAGIPLPGTLFFAD